MTQRKALGRKMWVGPTFNSNPAPRIYTDQAGQYQRAVIVFESESDFEAAARIIWVESIANRSFEDIWPELKRRILGEG